MKPALIRLCKIIGIVTVLSGFIPVVYATPKPADIKSSPDAQNSCQWTITIERIKTPNEKDSPLAPGLEVYFYVELYSVNSKEGISEKRKAARYPLEGTIDAQAEEEFLFKDEFAFVIDEETLIGDELWVDIKIRETDMLEFPCGALEDVPVIGPLFEEFCEIDTGNDTLADERIVIPVVDNPNGKRDYQFEHGMEASVVVFRNCY